MTNMKNKNHMKSEGGNSLLRLGKWGGPSPSVELQHMSSTAQAN